MENREVKDLLYEQVARISKAAASPKRLELIELLCQCEKTVETLARDAGLSVKLTSAHLKELKAARLVDSRKDGKYVYYRLADPAVAAFWVDLRALAEERLLDLQGALRAFVNDPEKLAPADCKTLLIKAKKGDVIVIDVRPQEEYLAGHLPYARSLPLLELKKRLSELPRNKEIVAYCRGPFCMMAKDAVALLRRRGYRAARLEAGVSEWRAAGLPAAAER
jgi:rhodanese-related sulfurtransferase/DNA-binding transcriptional ArsR family regulator